MDAMQANSNHMGTPISGGGTGAIARRDATTIKGDGHIEECARCLAHNTCRQMKT